MHNEEVGSLALEGGARSPMLAEEGTMVEGVAITEELRDGSGSKMPPVLEKESMPVAARKAATQHR